MPDNNLLTSINALMPSVIEELEAIASNQDIRPADRLIALTALAGYAGLKRDCEALPNLSVPETGLEDKVLKEAVARLKENLRNLARAELIAAALATDYPSICDHINNASVVTDELKRFEQFMTNVSNRLY